MWHVPTQTGFFWISSPCRDCTVYLQNSGCSRTHTTSSPSQKREYTLGINLLFAVAPLMAQDHVVPCQNALRERETGIQWDEGVCRYPGDRSCRHSSEYLVLTLPGSVLSPPAPASPHLSRHHQWCIISCLGPLPFRSFFCPLSALVFPWLLPTHTHVCLHAPSIVVVVAFITLSSLLMPHVLL